MKNGDECVPYCPPMTIYDPEQYRRVPNPDAKYTFGTICVDECPGEQFGAVGDSCRAMCLDHDVVFVAIYFGSESMVESTEFTGDSTIISFRSFDN